MLPSFLGSWKVINKVEFNEEKTFRSLPDLFAGGVDNLLFQTRIPAAKAAGHILIEVLVFLRSRWPLTRYTFFFCNLKFSWENGMKEFGIGALVEPRICEDIWMCEFFNLQYFCGIFRIIFLSALT